MDRLIAGYRRFRADIWPAERARYQALSELGQSPRTLVIACSDSRVDPQIVFGAGPGELFVIRNVAGLVPPYQPDTLYHGTSAALEFGVRVLKIPTIVVLGHAQCAGVRAVIEGAPDEAHDFVENWVRIARPVLQTVPAPGEDALSHFEREVVRLSLTNLMTFPWIAEAHATGKLALHGLQFSIHTGELSRLEGDRLVPV